MSFIHSNLNQANQDQATVFLSEMQAGIGFLGGRYFFHKDKPQDTLAFKEITQIFIKRYQNEGLQPSHLIISQLTRLNNAGNNLLNKNLGIAGRLLRFFHAISQILGNRFKKINHQLDIQLIQSFIPKTTPIPETIPVITRSNSSTDTIKKVTSIIPPQTPIITSEITADIPKTALSTSIIVPVKKVIPPQPETVLSKSEKEQQRLSKINDSVRENRELLDEDFKFLITLNRLSFNLRDWIFPIRLNKKEYDIFEFVDFLSAEIKRFRDSNKYFGWPRIEFHMNTEQAKQKVNQLLIKERTKWLKYQIHWEETPILDIFEDNEIVKIINNLPEQNKPEIIKKLLIANFEKLPNPKIAKALSTIIYEYRYSEENHLIYSTNFLIQNFQHICDTKGNLIEDWEKIIIRLGDLDENSKQDLQAETEGRSLQQKLCISLLEKRELKNFLTVFTILMSTRTENKADHWNKVYPLWSKAVHLVKDNPEEFTHIMQEYAVTHSSYFQDTGLFYPFFLFDEDKKFEAFIANFYGEAEKEERFDRLAQLLDRPGFNLNQALTLLQSYLNNNSQPILIPKILSSLENLNICQEKRKRVELRLIAYQVLIEIMTTQNDKSWESIIDLVNRSKSNCSKPSSISLGEVIKEIALICDLEQAIALLNCLIAWRDSVSSKLSPPEVENLIAAFTAGIFSDRAYKEDPKREIILEKICDESTPPTILNRVLDCIGGDSIHGYRNISSNRMQKMILSLLMHQESFNKDRLLHLFRNSVEAPRHYNLRNVILEILKENPMLSLSIPYEKFQNIFPTSLMRYTNNLTWKENFSTQMLDTLLSFNSRFSLVYETLNIPTPLTSIIAEYINPLGMSKRHIQISKLLSELSVRRKIQTDTSLFQEIRNSFNNNIEAS